jgi:hypothetical protein
MYWTGVWQDETERKKMLLENLQRIQGFRDQFAEFQAIHPALIGTLPVVLTKLYSDCQAFAESEIKLTLERFARESKAKS